MPVDEYPRKFYGQLQHILVVPMAAIPSVGQSARTLVLAVIRSYRIDSHDRILNIHYYPTSNQGSVDVVDIETIECLIGRVKDGNRWATVDRSDTLDYTTYIDDAS